MLKWLIAASLIAVGTNTLAEGVDLQPPKGISYRQVLLVQLAVKDLNQSVRFYTEMLGFVVIERRDDLKFVHLATNVDGLQIGLNEQSDPLGSGSVLLNIGVEDVASARQTLESRGVLFSRPTVVIPGKVTLAEFNDPDGNRLRFAGPAPAVSEPAN